MSTHPQKEEDAADPVARAPTIAVRDVAVIYEVPERKMHQVRLRSVKEYVQMPELLPYLCPDVQYRVLSAAVDNSGLVCAGGAHTDLSFTVNEYSCVCCRELRVLQHMLLSKGTWYTSMLRLHKFRHSP